MPPKESPAPVPIRSSLSPRWMRPEVTPAWSVSGIEAATTLPRRSSVRSMRSAGQPSASVIASSASPLAWCGTTHAMSPSPDERPGRSRSMKPGPCCSTIRIVAGPSIWKWLTSRVAAGFGAARSSTRWKGKLVPPPRTSVRLAPSAYVSMCARCSADPSRHEALRTTHAAAPSPKRGATCSSVGSTCREEISDEQTRISASSGVSARASSMHAVSRPTRNERQVAWTEKARIPEPPSPSSRCSSGPPSGRHCSGVPEACTMQVNDSGATPAASSACLAAAAAMALARSSSAAKRRSVTPLRARSRESGSRPPRRSISRFVTMFGGR
mmetsp:Transcript_19435/g.57598  ORF Transcript_19435/g.57598 Transcript_19435/m.57598 type:complete len:327 (+) Transcript_19435:319-1299(+)